MPRGPSRPSQASVPLTGALAFSASPDGKLVAFTVRETDVEANKGRTDVWMMRTNGGEPWRMTSSPEGDSSPRFSPDGKVVYFLSSRTGSSQVWGISLYGGEAFPVTVTTTVVSNGRVGSSAHSTSRKRSASRALSRRATTQSSPCTTRPSPRPR